MICDMWFWLSPIKRLTGTTVLSPNTSTTGSKQESEVVKTWPIQWMLRMREVPTLQDVAHRTHTVHDSSVWALRASCPASPHWIRPGIGPSAESVSADAAHLCPLHPANVWKVTSSKLWRHMSATMGQELHNWSSYCFWCTPQCARPSPKRFDHRQWHWKDRT